MNSKLKKITPKEAYDLFNPEVVWGRVYTSYFAHFPSCMTVTEIDPLKVAAHLAEAYREHVLYVHKRDFIDEQSQSRCSNTAFVYADELIVVVSVQEKRVEIFYSLNEEKALEIFKECSAFIEEKTGKDIFVVSPRNFSLKLRPLPLPELPLSIEDNYNDDFVPVHNVITTTLSETDKSGLVLLHGAPGTGKSTYIRHLIHHTEKKVIFLPPNLAANLDAPEFVTMLMVNNNSIVIIEDAEQLIVSRETAKNSSISMLLNLTDGLLGSCLGIQFICTFNTPLHNIDKALLRKGRLRALYEFKPLSSGKSKALLEKLGKPTNHEVGSMTLADIYNADAPDYQIQPINPIGFTSNS